jgi:hypothetical protein
MNWADGKHRLHRVPFFDSPPETITVEVITVSWGSSRSAQVPYYLDHVGANGIPHYRKSGHPRTRTDAYGRAAVSARNREHSAGVCFWILVIPPAWFAFYFVCGLIGGQVGAGLAIGAAVALGAFIGALMGSYHGLNVKEDA